MADFTINVSSSKTSRINLGIQGENIVEHVIFNISEWITDYGSGVAYIYATRSEDTEPYPIALEMDLEAGTATWNVSAVDTAFKGEGKAQLVYVVDEDNDNDYAEGEIKKTKVYATSVQTSIVSTTDVNPDAYETWLEVLGNYTARIEAANIAANAAKIAAQAAQAAAEAAQAAAETAEDSATAEATLARSYARGDTETRTGEETDSALYYKNQAEAAQDAAETAQGLAETAQGLAETARSGAEAAQSSTEREAAQALIDIGNAVSSGETTLQGYVTQATQQANNAAASAQAASGSASAASSSAAAALSSEQAAAGSATAAANSAVQAATSVANSGIIEMTINSDEHLIYTRTEVVAIDFDIDSNGHLIVEEAS